MAEGLTSASFTTTNFPFVGFLVYQTSDSVGVEQLCKTPYLPMRVGGFVVYMPGIGMLNIHCKGVFNIPCYARGLFLYSPVFFMMFLGRRVLPVPAPGARWLLTAGSLSNK